MRADQKPDFDKWFQTYCEDVTSQWKAEGGDLFAQYPELFQQTLDRIQAIMNELRPKVEKELADKQMKERDKPPATSDDPVPPKPARMRRPNHHSLRRRTHNNLRTTR